jgi:hypothetical protein
VLERGIAAERAQERFLERVLGGLAAEQAHEVAVDLVAVAQVEALERRNLHDGHLLL